MYKITATGEVIDFWQLRQLNPGTMFPDTGPALDDLHLWDVEWYEPPAVEPTPYIPQSITPRQARLVLSRAGLLPAINQTIAAIGGEAQIEWEYANEVLRSNPLLAVVAQQAGLTAAQLDQMFVEAAGL